MPDAYAMPMTQEVNSLLLEDRMKNHGEFSFLIALI